MICKCKGCFRRIPEGTTLCIPCQPIQRAEDEQIAPYHGPGGTHGYLGQADEPQLDAIHNLLESIDHDEHVLSRGAAGSSVQGDERFHQAVIDFYFAFRGE